MSTPPTRNVASPSTSSTVAGGGDPKAPVPRPCEPLIGGLEGALDRLRAARAAGRYYDESSDRAARESYYAGLPESPSPSDRFQALSKLLRETHAEQPTYHPAVELYPEIDLHPDGKLRSIYSKREIDAERAIRADFESILRVEEALEALRAGESFSDPEGYAEQVEALQASFSFNCEHVMPQSWFRKREPMRGDLHHLFACEPACNSFRGNTPYYAFDPRDDVLRSDCGRSEGGTQFEPEGGKGPVARATLYFVLRYPKQFGSTGKSYDARRIEMLLQWHREAPPSEYELHRNVGIHARQGNRNPLIDFPPWADQIDFTIGLPGKEALPAWK